MSIENIRRIKEEALLPKQKKIYHIKKVSDKRKKHNEEAKLYFDEAAEKEKWFALIRKKLTGTCQCGCSMPSQKKDDMYFRHSCCHIFPKSKFASIKYHPENYVERAFFGGCHGVMDDTSVDRWVNMEDWENIKSKFNLLSPLLTNEERATKFYAHIKSIVDEN